MSDHGPHHEDVPYERCIRRLTADRNRYRDALHTICGLTHQDIDDPPTREAFWRLISRIHSVARHAVEPPAGYAKDANAAEAQTQTRHTEETDHA